MLSGRHSELPQLISFTGLRVLDWHLTRNEPMLNDSSRFSKPARGYRQMAKAIPRDMVTVEERTGARREVTPGYLHRWTNGDDCRAERPFLAAQPFGA